MPDRAQHRSRGGADVDLADADPQRRHQRASVGERRVAGPEAGHRVGEHVRPRQAEAVDSPGGDDQRMGRVEPARDPDHDPVDPGRAKPRLQTRDLDPVDLLATLVAGAGFRRDVGEALDGTPQPDRPGRQPRARIQSAGSAADGGDGRAASHPRSWCPSGRRPVGRDRHRRRSGRPRRETARPRRADLRSRGSSPGHPRRGRWSTRPDLPPYRRTRRSCGPNARHRACDGSRTCRS